MTRRIGLNFHGVGNPKRPLESGEAPFWLARDQFDHVLKQVTDDPTPDKFMITFDDGNMSDHDVALPVLVHQGLHARFFVLTGRLGTAGSLDAAHIRALQSAGMTVGSHGIDHVVWPTLSDTALDRELRESKARLEDICGHAITEAGIPFGRYDERVLRALRRAGYKAAWTSDGGTLRQDAFLRPRTSLRGDTLDGTLSSALTGHMPALKRLRRFVGMTRRRFTVTG